jgi:4-alpha-glucanotransferase
MKTPIFNWLDQRGSGLLLHPTSLPSDHGIGTLGAPTLKALDFMYESGIHYWQVCPLGPTGFGDSPYQSFSAFALNPYLIDLNLLIEEGLLSKKEVAKLSKMPKEKVDYGALYENKWPVLRKAYNNFKKANADQVSTFGSFSTFKNKNQDWLHAYALFMAIKDSLNGASWDLWEPSISSYKKAAKSDLARRLSIDVDAYSFYQYLVYAQWQEAREYASDRSIEIIGDIPIFVAYDSADTWSNPDVFLLNKQGRPEVVAGVPPDYFSEDGQLWGNPLYNWDYLKRTKYQWWMKRCESNFKIYDIVRIDHFRGFCDYWEIPAIAKTAKNGKWKKGPGLSFFKALKDHFPDAKVIAEDLGIITEDVRRLRAQAGLPGMAILHFAFDGSEDNSYLPKNVSENCVIYPGTHDNDTTQGWLDSLSFKEKNQVSSYLNVNHHDLNWGLIKASMDSKCLLSVIALQDYLGFGSEARLNSPGIASGNWQWRCSEEEMDSLLEDQGQRIYELIESSGRYHSS